MVIFNEQLREKKKREEIQNLINSSGLSAESQTKKDLEREFKEKQKALEEEYHAKLGKALPKENDLYNSYVNLTKEAFKEVKQPLKVSSIGYDDEPKETTKANSDSDHYLFDLLGIEHQ